ncbi:MAG TPA: cation diffusion facilitator family transporter, partial [Chloroflexota bacterium]|nr:cation diffusion facilitator family transporter [Chloroflexota bacterium]
SDNHHHHHSVLTGDTAGIRLGAALGLTVIILVIEAFVGFRANSLALLSDAGHILTDVFALGLAWWALRRAGRPADEANTYGYQRVGILAALANAVVLVVIAVFLAFEAYGRLRHPQHVSGLPVILAAGAAIAVNTLIAAWLRTERGNLNVRAALLHVAGDIAASIGVVVSGAVILVTHAYIVDPIVSWLIAALIAVGAWRIVSETVRILMEGTPRGVDVGEVARVMREVPGVEDVHDLHIWALSDGVRLLSAHVTAPEQSLSSTATLLADLRLILARRFGIGHSTIEIECLDCQLPVDRPITLHESSRR